MAKRQFSITEAEITTLFNIGQHIDFEGKRYQITNAGKPSPPKGECKTDTYVLLEGVQGEQRDLKISIKQANADFLENKMNLERAIQIFGADASKIIAKSIKEIKGRFEEDNLVCFKKHKRTEAKTIKIGWKFELMNKTSGDKSGKMFLTQEQLLDIYAGTNLSEEKRNAKVAGEIVSNSGVANYIFIAEVDKHYSIGEVLENLHPIADYVSNKEIFFACKAVNYRASKDKWDGNRPLAVYVDWSYDANFAYARLNMDIPLQKKANEIGGQIREMLKHFEIDKDNFDGLKQKLQNVNFYGQ